VALGAEALTAAWEAGKRLSIDAALGEVDAVMADLPPAEPSGEDDRILRLGPAS